MRTTLNIRRARTRAVKKKLLLNSRVRLTMANGKEIFEQWLGPEFSYHCNEFGIAPNRFDAFLQDLADYSSCDYSTHVEWSDGTAHMLSTSLWPPAQARPTPQPQQTRALSSQPVLDSVGYDPTHLFARKNLGSELEVKQCLITVKYHFAKTARDMGEPGGEECFARVEAEAMALEARVIVSEVKKRDKNKKKTRDALMFGLYPRCTVKREKPPSVPHCCERGNECDIFQMFHH